MKLDATVVQTFYIECLYDACQYVILILFIFCLNHKPNFDFSCDTGGDCECLCTSLSAFAEKCQSINVPVKWRTQDKCRK